MTNNNQTLRIFMYGNKVIITHIKKDGSIALELKCSKYLIDEHYVHMFDANDEPTGMLRITPKMCVKFVHGCMPDSELMAQEAYALLD